MFSNLLGGFVKTGRWTQTLFTDLIWEHLLLISVNLSFLYDFLLDKQLYGKTPLSGVNVCFKVSRHLKQQRER